MPFLAKDKTTVVQRRDLYNLVRGFYGILSIEGILLDANQSALDFGGLELHEVTGIPFLETPWWRVCSRSRAALRDAIERGASGESSRFEARIGGKDGKIIDIDFSLTPIINDVGIVVSLVPEAHDITATKEAEKALQESEARLRLAYDAAGMGTWEWNLANNELYWSERQYELFGLPKPSGNMHVELALANIHPEDIERVKTANALAIEKNIPFREEFRVIHENGEIHWLVGQGRVLYQGEDGVPKSMIGVNYDATHRKSLELELAQTNLELEARVVERTSALEHEMRERQKAEHALVQSQQFEMIGQLAGGVAHDFNNLLAVIGGNLELATMRTADERVIQLINEALEAVEAGASLNRRLLSFAQKRSLEPVNLSVNNRIVKTKRLLERALGENITLETNLSADSWMTCVDPGELDSAIINLVLNARDAMPSGGKVSIATCNLTLKDDGLMSASAVQATEYIKVSVSDTGVGMAKEVQEKAFTPYFTTKESGKGSGLGLSSVFGFVTRSAGFVRIESEEGRGATVNIYLPRAAPMSKFIATEKPINDLPLGRGELILLVEDDEKVRSITQKRLVELGYRVIEAASAAEAITQLQGNEPVSLVFSDVRMPGRMSGYDLAKWVSENRVGIRVLLTSGYNNFAIEEGQDAKLLAKPYSLRKLACALHDALVLTNDS